MMESKASTIFFYLRQTEQSEHNFDSLNSFDHNKRYESIFCKFSLSVELYGILKRNNALRD
jgi:hypothetical protein